MRHRARTEKDERRLSETIRQIDSIGPAPNSVRFERSEWPHPIFPKHMKTGLIPDVIWLRFHDEVVTGWQSTEPNSDYPTPVRVPDSTNNEVTGI